MQKILHIDPEKCSGCRLCESVCSIHHERVCNPAWSRINVVKWDTVGLYVPMVCQQCETPLCEIACPMHAIRKNEKTGVVTVDDELCVGCKLCLMLCPFGGVSLDTRKGKILKCDLCDGDPHCVRFCEPKALQFLNATVANLKKKRDAARKFSDLMKKTVLT